MYNNFREADSYIIYLIIVNSRLCTGIAGFYTAGIGDILWLGLRPIINYSIYEILHVIHFFWIF